MFVVGQLIGWALLFVLLAAFGQLLAWGWHRVSDTRLIRGHQRRCPHPRQCGACPTGSTRKL